MIALPAIGHPRMSLVSRYLQLDVFPASPGGGNPIGVVLDARGWSEEQMQSCANWTGLVETTFVLPPTQAGASYRLRIFTPEREIPFAGHPTIGSAHAVLEAGIAEPVHGGLVQECGAGLLPIRIEGEDRSRRLYVQAPAARVLPDSEGHRPALDAVLARLDISQGGRWYRYRWRDAPPIPLAEIVRSSANMHLIPADDAVAAALRRIERGQRVRIDGWLVEVNANDGWRWRSSLTREDSGGGACELVYVCSIARE